jgi:hypothetical protein
VCTAGQQSQPGHDLPEDQIQQSYRHDRRSCPTATGQRCRRSTPWMSSSALTPDSFTSIVRKGLSGLPDKGFVPSIGSRIVRGGSLLPVRMGRVIRTADRDGGIPGRRPVRQLAGGSRWRNRRTGRPCRRPNNPFGPADSTWSRVVWDISP